MRDEKRHPWFVIMRFMDFLFCTNSAYTSMEKTIICIRHGETDEKYRNRYIGSTDVPLSARGQKQAAALKNLPGVSNPALCLCSPLIRCRETADILLNGLGLQYEIDEKLREIDFGLWEGLTFTEIAAEYPREVEKWAAFEEDFVFPEGESLRNFLKRIMAIATMINSSKAGTVSLITHGGIIRFLICHLLQLDPRQHILFEVKTASLTTIKLYDGAGVLAGLNETGDIS